MYHHQICLIRHAKGNFSNWKEETLIDKKMWEGVRAIIETASKCTNIVACYINHSMKNL